MRLLVYCLLVQAQLTYVVRVELIYFHFYRNVSMHRNLVKKQIHELVCGADHQMVFTGDEGKARSHFHQCFLNVIHQAPLEHCFVVLLSHACVIENVRVFCQLSRQVAVRWWQCAVKVVDGLSLAVVQVCVQPVEEDSPAPSMLECLMHVEEPFCGIAIYLVDDVAVVGPRDAEEFGYDFWESAAGPVAAFVASDAVDETNL